jgi:hypothetical protein
MHESRKLSAYSYAAEAAKFISSQEEWIAHTPGGIQRVKNPKFELKKEVPIETLINEI